MKVGDLVTKIKGYGHDQRWAAIVLEINTPYPNKIAVFTEGEIEYWVSDFVEKL